MTIKMTQDILDHFAFEHNVDVLFSKKDKELVSRWLRKGIPSYMRKQCKECERIEEGRE